MKAAPVCAATVYKVRARMATISLQIPVFATYAIAASLMILKAVSMSWLTVWRMMQERVDTAHRWTEEDAAQPCAAPVANLAERAGRAHPADPDE